MKLENIFSIGVFIGLVFTVAFTIIGLTTSMKTFYLIFIPFSIIALSFVFLYFKDSLELKSDRAYLFVILLLLSLFLSFFAGSVKAYSDTVQRDQALIDSQLIDNQNLKDMNDYKMSIAQSKHATVEEYQNASKSLEKKLDNLLSQNTEKIVVQESIQPVDEPVYVYEDYYYEDDDHEDDEEEDDD